jgi:hypothetical protein
MRNLAIRALSRAGPVNLAAALRQHAGDPIRPLTSLGITSDERPSILLFIVRLSERVRVAPEGP